LLDRISPTSVLPNSVMTTEISAEPDPATVAPVQPPNSNRNSWFPRRR
jgi:hypothetical protein